MYVHTHSEALAVTRWVRTEGGINKRREAIICECINHSDHKALVSKDPPVTPTCRVVNFQET